MKDKICLYCQSKLDYVKLSHYQKVSCPNINCKNEACDEINFIGFADFIDDPMITDYSLLIIIDDKCYTFGSSILNNSPYSYIDYRETNEREDSLRIYEWKEFIEFKDNLEFYITKVKRLINLKAFW